MEFMKQLAVMLGATLVGSAIAVGVVTWADRKGCEKQAQKIADEILEAE